MTSPPRSCEVPECPTSSGQKQRRALLSGGLYTSPTMAAAGVGRWVRRSSVTIAVAVLLGPASAGPAGQQVVPLVAGEGSRITVDTGPGQQHRYELSLAAGTFLHLVVHQR